jgi:hypothetical protein
MVDDRGLKLLLALDYTMKILELNRHSAISANTFQVTHNYSNHWKTEDNLK